MIAGKPMNLKRCVLVLAFSAGLVARAQTTSNMALIPAGSFVMGASTNVGHESKPSETPQHTVYVSGFYMDRYEVTKMLWDEVTAWALSNGYAFENVGAGEAPSHPVQMVTWYDCVKWCNARSQKEGLTPCYTVNGLTYKAGNISNLTCSWFANGYRLPTEAEWEKAARGGAANLRFPWSDVDTIQHARANYRSSTSDPFDTSPTLGHHPTFNDGVYPYTSPVGYFAPNGYGLYDMAGNVYEWCWDWSSSSYYGNSPGTDPRGADSGSERVLRGGSWHAPAFLVRVANRYDVDPADKGDNVGLRCVRGGAPSVLALPDYVLDPALGPHYLTEASFNAAGMFSFVSCIVETGGICVSSWSYDLVDWYPLVDYEAVRGNRVVDGISRGLGCFYRTTCRPFGVLLADQFTYPVQNGEDVPEQITPESNTLYQAGAVDNPSRGAVSPSSGWYNIQDVGSYYAEEVSPGVYRWEGLHPGEDWNRVGGDKGQSVHCIANGQVIDIRPAASSGQAESLGYMVLLRHWLPNGNIVDSLYVHVAPDSFNANANDTGVIGLETDFTFQEGASVTQGAVICVIGDVSAVPDHLHFELRSKETNPNDPWPRDAGDGYYGPAIGAAGNRSPTILQPDVSAAFGLMTQDGIIDPSDFIDNN